ncbi:MAG TPA: hypothetical protein CFH81_00425 [Sulfurovum sp. UBA12169]|nr:MAG TPA: hypothetical protein CFH81_00425 [Sulfurovum sp. UBA12169]
MATIAETEQWEDGIYQLETTDPVEGGTNGIDNTPHKHLANRTLWLKAQIEALAQSLSIVDANTLQGKTVSDIQTLIINAITNGAGAAYDTLLELQQEIQANDNDITGILYSISLRLTNIVEDTTPQLGGSLDGDGNYIKDVWYNQLADVTVSTGTHTIYFSDGNRKKITAGGNFTIAFGGVSANQNVYIIEAVNWGAYTITFPAGLKVEDGALPEFTVSGTDLIAIEVDKNGTYTLSVIAQNIGVIV